ncbi:MAG: HEPN domain-containing protein [Armatimonadota bacterium]
MTELEQRRKLVRAWLGRANQDIQAAEVLNQYQASFPDVIFFHCRQAAEKALRAYLQWAGVPPPQTHDIALLLGLCAELQPSLEEAAEACRALRSPAADPLEGPEDALLPPDEALEYAHHVLDCVTWTLPYSATVDQAD